MKEDIKILEDLAETLNKTCENGICEASTSIENLIKELKDSDDLLISMALELRQNEEYIRELEEDNQKFESGKFLTPAQCVRIGKDYIPKSKVKEKIEELDKKEKEELKGLKGQDRYFVKQMYMYKRNILQELIEDK